MLTYTINSFNRDFLDDNACLKWLKNHRYPDGIYCTKCGKVTNHYRIKNRTCYSCYKCGTQVYPMANTIYEKSTTSLKDWFYAMYLMANTRCGISAKQLQRELGVTYKTAWRMFHKIREMMYEKHDRSDTCDKTFELDETYIGGKHKGKCGRGSENKSVVFGIAQRKKKIIAKHVENAKSKTLLPIVAKNIQPHAIIYTDEFRSYNKLTDMDYYHEKIHHCNKEYVLGKIHINNIEGFWSIMKRGISGVYHSVSSKHLNKYINEYVFRYNHREDTDLMFYYLLCRASSPCQT